MRDRWYVETAKDPAVRARALAAAGVLTAAGWRPHDDTPAESLSAAIRAAASRPLAWTYPDAGAIRLHFLATDHALAATWDKCWQRRPAFGMPSARLVVDTESLRDRTLFGGSTASAIAALSRELLAEEAVAAGRRPGLDLEPGQIAAVSFATFRDTSRHEWSWPLRLRVGPSATRELEDCIKRVGAAERHGFLQVADPGAPDHDVVLLAEPSPRWLRGARGQPWGIGVIGTPWRQRAWGRDRLLRSALSAAPAGAIAFLPVGREFLSDWVNEFAYAVSHNKSLDEAVFGAYRNILPRLSKAVAPAECSPPILLTAVSPAVHDVLEDVRLENRVKELVAELDRGRRARIELPPDLVSCLGIQPSSHTAGDYALDLTTALARGAFDFDREVDGALALRLIRASVSRTFEGAPIH